LTSFRADGCGSRNIYREKVTGARANRRELNRMLGKLALDDVVTVTRIDRLARTGPSICLASSSASWTPRRNSGHWPNRGPTPAPAPGRLMIAVSGGLADVESDLIRTRTAEGRSRAKARGQQMGRKTKLTDAQQAEARKRRAEGATLAELGRSYGVGKSTISRLAVSTPLSQSGALNLDGGDQIDRLCKRTVSHAGSHHSIGSIDIDYVAG
jgi:DNA invertase Pin-like site-specific DNA recombinase